MGEEKWKMYGNLMGFPTVLFFLITARKIVSEEDSFFSVVHSKQ
jgi:hypothetical protein